MRAGDLRRRITIQLKGTAADTFGQASTSWTDFLTCWAAISPLSGRELVTAQAINAEITHQISIRYLESLANPMQVAAMRIVYQNGGVTRYFNVLSSQNVDERNRELLLSASEGLNLG